MPHAGDEALAPFLDGDGRLRSMPRRWTTRLLVLRHLAARFEPGREYREREVTAGLAAWSTCSDPVTLRRELVDAGLLRREADGSAYRRAAGPDPAP